MNFACPACGRDHYVRLFPPEDIKCRCGVTFEKTVTVEVRIK